MGKHKDTGMFKMPHRRGCDTVKLVFSAYELSLKPVKFWANVGTVNKKKSFQKIISLVKRLTGDSTINGISHIAYYGGSRLLFPFHVNWLGNRFELTIYNVFGEQGMSISRGVKSNNERLNKEEIKAIEDFIRVQYHIVWDGYSFLKEHMKEAKNYTDVRAKISEIKVKLTAGIPEGLYIDKNTLKP